ncbi:MAG: hypothetical protein SFU83_00475 [Meiothermus sp.]|nr:hypothetical protein [Meiothermus sp.]
MSRPIEQTLGQKVRRDVTDDTGLVVAVAGWRVDYATLELARLADAEDQLLQAVLEAKHAEQLEAACARTAGG